MHVSLSLWSVDQAHIADEIKRYGPLIDSFHIDVMDGRFADDLLFGPLMVEVVRALTDKPIAAHLMVDDPMHWIPRFASAGANTIVFHPSAHGEVPSTISAINAAGCAAGLALALHESEQPALDNLAGLAELYVMGTAVGVRGRPLNRQALELVRTLSAVRPAAERPMVLVDGGIRWSSVSAIASAGGQGVVAGSIVANADDAGAAAVRLATM